jgi:hypothetical protein
MTGISTSIGIAITIGTTITTAAATGAAEFGSHFNLQSFPADILTSVVKKITRLSQRLAGYFALNRGYLPTGKG